jgi:hypothetical protein
MPPPDGVSICGDGDWVITAIDRAVLLLLSFADTPNRKAGAECEYQQDEHREHHHNHAHKVLQHFVTLQTRVIVNEDWGMYPL